MRNPLWNKVLRDLWGNKTRTLLVVLSIAVGVFAIGTIVSTRIILARELPARYAATNPASATIFTHDPFDEDLVQVVRGMREVQDAEGRRRIPLRLRIGTGEWRDIEIFAIPDYDDIRVNQVWPERGAWPPPERELLIERAALDLIDAQVGDTVVIESPAGEQRELRIAGLVHDITQPPAVFVGSAYGYITFATLEWLGEPRTFDELHIVVARHANDEAHIRQVAKLVRDRIEKSGRAVFATQVTDPGEPPIQDVLESTLVLLGALGVLALLLSGFLVVNTIAALLAQQVRQIGAMKAVGARVHQITDMYLGMTLIFGVLALLIAIPLGALGAFAATNFVTDLLNFDRPNFTFPVQALVLEVAVGLIVPVCAALYPVLTGTRITVRAALSSHGIAEHTARPTSPGLLVTALSGLFSMVSRPVVLSLRNTSRRKGRLALTLITLTLGGAIFIAVFSVRASLLQTLDQALNYWQYDVSLRTTRPERTFHIEQEAMRVPGVVRAESWGFAGTRRLRPDDTESQTILMLAPPAETRLIQPIVLQGRWLLSEDENAIVINTDMLKDERDISVGDWITLNVNGRAADWRVVGIVQGVLTGPTAYVNYPYFARVDRTVGRASSLRVVTTRHDPAFQSQVAGALEAHFESIGLRVRSTATIADVRTRIVAQFNIIIALLVIMATLLATVGGLGLMGTMSINVIERTREIGVMRAIGASNGAILQIVLVEGIVIGLLSWLIAAVLAFPLGKFLSDAVGVRFVQTPLSYTFALSGVVLWLGLVVLLAALASLLPAHSAARLTVRDVLAYE